jgi:hypothetical protein
VVRRGAAIVGGGNVGSFAAKRPSQEVVGWFAAKRRGGGWVIRRGAAIIGGG